MADRNTIITVVIIIIVVALIYYFFFRPIPPQTPVYYENFHPIQDDHANPTQIDNSNQSLEPDNLALDKITCHPSCCGNQWPVPFDGLNADELQQRIANTGTTGPHIRTSYTCANGPNGVGCPCVTPRVYANIVNRGQKSSCTQIEPTLLINRNYPQQHHIMPLYDSNPDNQQVLSDHRQINDVA